MGLVMSGQVLVWFGQVWSVSAQVPIRYESGSGQIWSGSGLMCSGIVKPGQIWSDLFGSDQVLVGSVSYIWIWLGFWSYLVRFWLGVVRSIQVWAGPASP